MLTSIPSPSPVMERYVFRPFGQIAIVGTGALLILFMTFGAQAPDARQAGAVEQPPPTLNLKVAGDIQHAVHFEYVQDREGIRQGTTLVAPLYVLPVSPHEWLKIYTNSPLGLPHSARARIYRSARPKPCFGGLMIGCIEVDTETSGRSIALYPEAAASFGFTAPSAPGSYWVALDADWGFGGSTQVFVIDVRG